MESVFNLLSIILWLHWSLNDSNFIFCSTQVNEQPKFARLLISVNFPCVWAQIFKSSPWACPCVRTCLWVSATLWPVPLTPRSDDGLRKPTSLWADAETQHWQSCWQDGAGSQTHCCRVLRTHTAGVKGSVWANLSSEPGYGEALIAALAKFQRAKSSKTNYARSRRFAFIEDEFLSTNFTSGKETLSKNAS